MLAALPPEILTCLVRYLMSARCVSSLSKTCRLLHVYVETEGWRVFVQARFPSFRVSSMWKSAAHALTTQSRNFDRRAFLARELEPKCRVLCLPRGTLGEYQGHATEQTMGYQAMVDSHQMWTGSDWATHDEVVAWGAGAELVMKITQRGHHIASMSKRRRADAAGKGQIFESDRSTAVRWIVYRDSSHREGRDDITSMRLMPYCADKSRRPVDQQDVLIGRASGGLSIVSIIAENASCHTKRSFDTGGMPLRSMDLSSGSPRMLAASLGDQKLSVYALDGPEDLAMPSSDSSSTRAEDQGCRTWSTRFISDREVAVGRGPSSEIVHVYRINNAGISQVRKLTAGSRSGATTSVYPIATISESACGPSAGSAFLTGGYDGNIRLHDLRSPKDCNATIADPIDRSSIFSLIVIGREKVVAGASMNSLVKVFDLRMAGGRMYSCLDLCPFHGVTKANNTDNEVVSDSWTQEGFANICESGFNIFASERTTSRRTRDFSAQRHRQSPVYSLSRPSSTSTSLYAGLENYVVHFNFSRLLDAYPDPTFRTAQRKQPNLQQKYDPIRTWYPTPDAWSNLSIYEHSGPRQMRMLHQRGLDQFEKPRERLDKFRQALRGYDERLWDFKRISDTLSLR